jgi:uncharacterized protein YdeI (YjbR/CyaY-like superfamily)
MKIASGTVHEIPEKFVVLFKSSETLLDLWENLTPLGRNEWICWVTSGKKEATKVKRMDRMVEELLEGKKRPCCWPGCPHR